MNALTKDVLYPGTWVLADGRRITVSRADLANAVRHGNEMLRRNIPAPWCWEHNLDAYPAAFSGRNDWFAKGYFGKTLSYKLGKNARGPVVEMNVGLFDDADRKQLERVSTVSPMLVWDYVDPTGQEWPGLTIGHVAATPKPIQANQGKFRNATLSGLSARCRSFACLGESVRGEAMAKDDDDGDEVATGGGGSFTQTLDLLSQLGVNVGDGVTDMESLNVALSALVASGVNATAGAVAANTDGEPGPDVGAAGIGPMVMSGLPPATQKAFATFLNTERIGLTKRVDALFESGRVPKSIRDTLANRVQSATLSILSDGSLRQNTTTIEIAAYEKLPAGASWAKTGGKAPAHLSDLRTVPHPAIATDPREPNDERQKELIEFMTATVRKPAAPVAAN